MAGTSKKTIAETIDARIAALQDRKAMHLRSVDEINAQLGIAELLKDDLLNDNSDDDNNNASSAPEAS